jgi:alkanesulfonate monooxygenase SsuD/methylene tetrahydromethanopterin reductase-like flavin-dependent oxidoreductase (luciferase family)
MSHREDRSNRRIQVFDVDGRFLRMFTIDVPPPPGTRPVNGNTPTGQAFANAIGAPNSICITPGPNQGGAKALRGRCDAAARSVTVTLRNTRARVASG